MLKLKKLAKLYIKLSQEVLNTDRDTPEKMIKGMAMYEIFYAQKLYKAKDALTRYDNDWSKSNEKIFKFKDNADIDSLIGMNKGRKKYEKGIRYVTRNVY